MAIGFSNALELLARETEKAERRLKLAVGDLEADAKILGVDPELWKFSENRPCADRTGRVADAGEASAGD